MNTTSWLSPGNIAYIPDPNTTNSDWTDWIKKTTNFIFPVLTKHSMRRVAVHDLATTAIFADTLIMKGFAIPTYNVIHGIVVRVNVRRQSRITDYLVQMHLNGVPFASNLATQDPSAPNVTYYGSSTELWGTDPSVNFRDSNFGLLFQVGPHPYFPGADEAIIDDVAIQVYYT